MPLLLLVIQKCIGHTGKGQSHELSVHPEDACQRSTHSLVVLTIKDIKKHDRIQNGQLLGKYAFAGVWIGHCAKL